MQIYAKNISDKIFSNIFLSCGIKKQKTLVMDCELTIIIVR